MDSCCEYIHYICWNCYISAVQTWTWITFRKILSITLFSIGLLFVSLFLQPRTLYFCAKISISVPLHSSSHVCWNSLWFVDWCCYSKEEQVYSGFVHHIFLCRSICFLRSMGVCNTPHFRRTCKEKMVEEVGLVTHEPTKSLVWFYLLFCNVLINEYMYL